MFSLPLRCLRFFAPCCYYARYCYAAAARVVVIAAMPPITLFRCRCRHDSAIVAMLLMLLRADYFHNKGARHDALRYDAS